jgi:hypothetical protein
MRKKQYEIGVLLEVDKILIVYRFMSFHLIVLFGKIIK